MLWCINHKTPGNRRGWDRLRRCYLSHFRCSRPKTGSVWYCRFSSDTSAGRLPCRGCGQAAKCCGYNCRAPECGPRRLLMTLSSSAPSFQSGVGLIELLIGLLVLTIGLLGMASMQTNGLQMTGGSLARSQAIILASDYVERIRANRTNRTDYAVAAGDVPSTCNTGFEPNGAASLAANDRAEWLNSVVCLLPASDATVTLGGTVNSVVTVTVTWGERSGVDGDGVIVVRSQI